ncbi:MAG: hypothetical protein ACLFQO_17250 [Cyclobacteriaceae bacterium]
MNKFMILCMSACVAVLTFAFHMPGSDLVKKQLTENIQVSLPATFLPMDENMLSERYLSARKPIAAFTNENQLVDFTVNTSNTRWGVDDLPILKDFYKASLMELYDEVEFSRAEIEEINKQPYVVFEFTSVVRPEENAMSMQQPVLKYTRVQYTVYDNETLVFNFSCPQMRQQEWAPTAREIMQSIKLK